MDRRQELKQQYKQMKSDMGIFMIRSTETKKCFIQSTKDLRGVMNGAKFKLQTGSHPNRELQREWKEFGEDHFVIEILERLEYEKDEAKTDYSEELSLLEMIWEERMMKENYTFYQK